MDTIFDGIQRPLTEIAARYKDVFIPRGVDVPSLDQSKQWQYTPGRFAEGNQISGGDIMGTVFENELITEHKIMCPPNICGEIVRIYGAGTDGKDLFHVNEPVMEVYNANNDKTYTLNLSHFWPVRRPRPCVEKMAADKALTTGNYIHNLVKWFTFLK